eukprot:scaffold264_cov317-Pinguiococcus_pyrenoidosus.AAC.22
MRLFRRTSTCSIAGGGGGSITTLSSEGNGENPQGPSQSYIPSMDDTPSCSACHVSLSPIHASGSSDAASPSSRSPSANATKSGDRKSFSWSSLCSERTASWASVSRWTSSSSESSFSSVSPCSMLAKVASAGGAAVAESLCPAPTSFFPKSFRGVSNAILTWRVPVGPDEAGVDSFSV